MRIQGRVARNLFLAGDRTKADWTLKAKVHVILGRNLGGLPASGIRGNVGNRLGRRGSEFLNIILTLIGIILKGV